MPHHPPQASGFVLIGAAIVTPGGTRVFRFCVLDFAGQDTREKDGENDDSSPPDSMVSLQTYGLSVGCFDFSGAAHPDVITVGQPWSRGRP